MRAYKLLQRAYDTIRTDILAALGFTILRFWNDEVLTNLQEVLQKTGKYIIKREPLYKRVAVGEEHEKL